MNKAKVRAYLVPKDAIDKDRFPSYNELCDGVREIVPIRMSNAKGYDYMVLEDSKDQVYLIKNRDAKAYQLDKRPLDPVKTNYFVDRTGEEPAEEVEISSQLEDVVTEVKDEPVSEEYLEEQDENFNQLDNKENE